MQLKFSNHKEEFPQEFEKEFEPQLTQDPPPGDPPAAKRSGRPTVKQAPSTARMAKQVAADLTSLLEGTAAVWGLRDQCCAPVLEQQAAPIAEALVGILKRNPRLLAKFADTDIVAYTLQAAALANAVAPLAKAVYRNHVSRAVDDEQDQEHAHAHATGAIKLGNFPPFRPPFQPA